MLLTLISVVLPDTWHVLTLVKARHCMLNLWPVMISSVLKSSNQRKNTGCQPYSIEKRIHYKLSLVFLLIISYFQFTFYFVFRGQSTIDRIFEAIRDLASNNRRLKLSQVKEVCSTKGFQPNQIDECLVEYERLNIWHINQTRTILSFM